MIKRLFKNLFSTPTPGVYLSWAMMMQIASDCRKLGISYVAIHYVGVANADTSGTAITNYHKNTLGWKKDGYHIFLNHDGKVEFLEKIGERVNGCKATGKSWWKPWSKIPSNEEYIGVKCLHICFETIEGYQMSPTQDKVLINLFLQLIKFIPNILIAGHRELPDFENYNKRQNTLCPGYSVSDWLMANGIPKANCFYEVWKP